MKTVFDRVNRSGVYYLISTLAPINLKRKAKFDALGGVMVVALVAGLVAVMRLILAK
jgi:hypothetical protein